MRKLIVALAAIIGAVVVGAWLFCVAAVFALAAFAFFLAAAALGVFHLSVDFSVIIPIFPLLVVGVMLASSVCRSVWPF